MPFDEEELDQHAECRHEIKRLEAVIAEMRAFGTIPAEDVAKYFLESEQLYYQRPFDVGTLNRLSAVIRRARIDGANSLTKTEQ